MIGYDHIQYQQKRERDVIVIGSRRAGGLSAVIRPGTAGYLQLVVLEEAATELGGPNGHPSAIQSANPVELGASVGLSMENGPRDSWELLFRGNASQNPLKFSWRISWCIRDGEFCRRVCCCVTSFPRVDEPSSKRWDDDRLTNPF